MKKFITVLLVAILSLTALSALAEWPERAIELIVPANPGGDTDANARALAAALNEELGWNVIVSNMNGGSGSVAFEDCLSNPSDGYRFVFYHNGGVTSEIMGMYDFSIIDDFKLAGMPFMDYVRETVLNKAGMTETWAKVPSERIRDCQSYDPEYRIMGGKRIMRTGLKSGIPHDPKAAVIQAGTEDLCGHAGLFSTAADMTRFCRAVLEEKIVSRESLREMAENRTGHLKPDGTYTQYLGYQCYVRHPDQYYSEIPRYMGRQAFGNAGFTGNHLSVDPEHGSFVFFLRNRVKGKLTMLIPETGKTFEDYGINADGSGNIAWDDKIRVPSSVKYVHQKDKYLHSAIAKVLNLPEIEFNS